MLARLLLWWLAGHEPSLPMLHASHQTVLRFVCSSHLQVQGSDLSFVHLRLDSRGASR